MPTMSKHPGSTSKGRLSEALSPEYFLFDERSTTDFLKYIRDLSKKVAYFNSKYQLDGDWEAFFMSDECFILADIAEFNVWDYDQRRMGLLQSFDLFATLEAKSSVFTDVFGLVYLFLQKANEWYQLASRHHKDRKGSIIEDELSSAIEYSLRNCLHTIISFELTAEDSGLPLKLNSDYSEFHAIWKIGNIEPNNIFNRGSTPVEQINNALKQLLLVYRTVFRVISTFVAKAPGLLQNTLQKDDRHQPHIGLLLTFLELYRYLQGDLNKLTNRHLNYYYRDILKQQPAGRIPDRVFLSIELTDSFNNIIVEQGNLLLAGQNPQGFNRYYALDREVHLSQVKICQLKTLFVSRNKTVDQNSQFRMVSGIYANPIADSADGKGAPQKNFIEGWPSLGEEQRHRSPDDRTMPDARVGFAIASPTLKLSSGFRQVEVSFTFTAESVQYLTTLLIDIANNRGLKPEEIFYFVFSSSFTIDITGENGWIPIKDYQFFPKGDWSSGVITLSFGFDQATPPIVSYNEAVHQAGYPLNRPVLRILLLGSDSNNPYSFLEGLRLTEVNIVAKVQKLKDLSVYNNFGFLDTSNSVEIFGPIPKLGSYLLIGHEELFSKNITSIGLSWEFDPLPIEAGGLKEYYAAYNRKIDNSSFKFRLSALSDYGFKPELVTNRQEFNLFESEKSGRIKSTKVVENIDLKLLDIRPAYDFNKEEIHDAINKLRAGMLKLELTEPSIGFGFDLFSRVFSEAVSENAVPINLLQGEKAKKPLPNNPLTPKISQIQVNYEASSSLIFDSRRSYQNDLDADESYLHLHPFGYSKLFSAGKAVENSILPHFLQEGELYIGLDGLDLPQPIHLLFELTRSDKWEFAHELNLEWHYLRADVWKPFSKNQILEDTTKGFIVTGILSIELPTDMTKDNHLLDARYYWIKASVTQKAELVSRIVSIQVNAVTATNVTEAVESDTFTGIEANVIRDFVDPIPGVVGIRQSFPSFGGQVVESEEVFYARASETLRHKNRSISRWDFERMALGKFDWISQAKCIGHTGNELFVNKGEVYLVAIPKAAPNSRFYEPKLSPDDIRQLEDFLQSTCNPFVRIIVRNPSYEYVRIKCKIMFNSSSHGLILKQLQNDILNYICPWFYSQNINASLGGSIKKSDLINFIQSRSYVTYLTGISIIQLQTNLKGDYLMLDTAVMEDGDELIQGATPWSVLVPSQYHDIEVLKREEYHAPEATSFSDLIIGENLVIISEPIISDNEIPKLDSEEKPTLEQAYQFTIKI
jgi:hypothetical protein